MVDPQWHSQVCYPTLMPSGPESTQTYEPATKPIKPIQPSDNSGLAKASCLQSIRQHHGTTGVLEKTLELLLAGWSTRTNAAQQSGWERWNRWCGEQEINPVSYLF